MKGIDDSDIFFSDQDKLIFLEKIKLVQKKFPFQIYAYCLMSNHVHIVLKVEDKFLSKSMQSLAQRYTRYFNTTYNRKGTMFQDRYFSKNVENLKYFLDVCRYVHRNPEQACMALTAQYKWSSYLEYVGTEKIIDKKTLLAYFNNNIDDFVRFTNKKDEFDELINYANFEMNTHISDEEIVEILKKICDVNSVEEIFSYFKIKENRKILVKFKDIKEVKINQLSRVTRVNKKAIKKALER